MNARAFKLLAEHGTRFRFGGTPKLGCCEGLFVLETMLNMRKNHNLLSYVGFVDLVKAYATANHDLLFDILERYGAPPRFVLAIERIYKDLVVVLKIKKEVMEIPQSVRVRQGNNMAPVLFLFLMKDVTPTTNLPTAMMCSPRPTANVRMLHGNGVKERQPCTMTLKKPSQLL